jgi:hypothetical protein
MNNQTVSTRELRAKLNGSRTLWLWIGGSAIGALVGAWLALTLFPSAAFARNPTGQFGWNLVGFALSIGIPLAISQWLALRCILRYREAAHSLFLVLWIPATSIGIALMILPLWWWNAEQFALMPWLVAFPMLPGMISLGLAQWLLLYRLISGRFIWALLTIMGAAIGSILGLVAAFFLQPISLELTWAFMTGAGIGVLQSIGLAADLEVDRSGQKQQIKLPIIVLGSVLGLLLLYYAYAYLASQASRAWF